MADVQKGMKSAGFPGLGAHPVDEQPIIAFHRSLAEFMGTGAPEPLG